jgi:hypothetical protein
VTKIEVHPESEVNSASLPCRFFDAITRHALKVFSNLLCVAVSIMFAGIIDFIIQHPSFHLAKSYAAGGGLPRSRRICFSSSPTCLASRQSSCSQLAWSRPDSTARRMPRARRPSERS